MATLYVVCLMLGGILIGLSLFAGSDADVDLLDAGGEVDIDAAAVAGEGIAAAARFLSFRNLIFLVAFFGLTGSLFTLLQLNPMLTLAAAVTVGSLAALAMHRLMSYLRGSETGAAPTLQGLEGSLGQVVIAFDEVRPGKVSIQDVDRTHQLVARVHEHAAVRRFATGEQVVIVHLDNGTAHVAENTFIA